MLFRSDHYKDMEDENERLKETVQYCREFWGEADGIHNHTGKSCVICGIEKRLNPKKQVTNGNEQEKQK